MIGMQVPPPDDFLMLQIEGRKLDLKVQAAVRKVATKFRGEVTSALHKAKTGRMWRVRRRVGRTGVGNWRRVQASAPGEEPGIATGTMLAALRTKYWRKNYGARIYASRKAGAYYRHMIEFGTKPRPAVRAKRKLIGRNIFGMKKYRPLTAAERGNRGQVLPRPMWSPMQRRMDTDITAEIQLAVDDFGRGTPVPNVPGVGP